MLARIKRNPFRGGMDPNATIHEQVAGPGSIQPSGWYRGHSWSSSLGHTNVLEDPAFETLPVASVAIGTSATVVGGWRALYVLNSGTAPTTILADIGYGRLVEGASPFNSAAVGLALDGFGSNAADLDIYFYPETAYLPRRNVLAHLVAGVKASTPDVPSATITSADLTLEIYNTTDAAVVASSPVYDVQNAPQYDMAQLSVADEQTPAVFRAKSYRWRLKLHVVKPASTNGAVRVLIGEPQLHFNFSPDPLPYAPLIGAYGRPRAPEAVGANQALTASTVIVAPAYATLCTVNAAAGACTLPAPNLSTGFWAYADGQEITVLNVGANDITFTDQGTLGGSNVRLTAATLVLTPRDSIRFAYSAAIGDWVQIGNLVSVL